MSNFNYVSKFIFASVIVTLIEFVLYRIGYSSSIGIFLLAVLRLLVLGFIVYYSCVDSRIKKTTKRLAEGNTSVKVNTENMFGEMKKQAENLNSVSNGISIAVAERVKSERFKAELITNVSHDIKTPLTSIITYVDLLKKEEIDNETANKYIEVIDRQSVRLKRLTNDLVEASKASTGNINVNFEEINVSELITQSVGEYSERLEESGITPILTLKDNTYIYADGALLWRVFDNCLSNICKYAMRDTRVYAGVVSDDKYTLVEFKNISAAPLNFSTDELMQRFVRGDVSRSSEGSGLGLSIAKSLTELQNGSFEISIDGDLYKVTIKFLSINKSERDGVTAINKQLPT